MKRSNSVKRAARIIKQGSSYDNIISTVSNLLSSTKKTEDSTDYILQATPSISPDTLNDSFICISGKINDLHDLKKRTVAFEIESKWGKDIIKEGARKIT